jgi:hypothetical protein
MSPPPDDDGAGASLCRLLRNGQKCAVRAAAADRNRGLPHPAAADPHGPDASLVTCVNVNSEQGSTAPVAS